MKKLSLVVPVVCCFPTDSQSFSLLAPILKARHTARIQTILKHVKTIVTDLKEQNPKNNNNSRLKIHIKDFQAHLKNFKKNTQCLKTKFRNLRAKLKDFKSNTKRKKS